MALQKARREEEFVQAEIPELIITRNEPAEDEGADLTADPVLDASKGRGTSKKSAPGRIEKAETISQDVVPMTESVDSPSDLSENLSMTQKDAVDESGEENTASVDETEKEERKNHIRLKQRLRMEYNIFKMRLIQRNRRHSKYIRHLSHYSRREKAESLAIQMHIFGRQLQNYSRPYIILA